MPLNTRLAAPEIAYMLATAGRGRSWSATASRLVAAELAAPTRRLAALADASPQADLAGGSPQRRSSIAEPPSSLDDPALMLYTSGTTGRPKAAMLTHGNLTWNTVNYLAHVDVLSTDRALCIAPLFHCVGLGQVTLPTLFKGGSVERAAQVRRRHRSSDLVVRRTASPASRRCRRCCR